MRRPASVNSHASAGRNLRPRVLGTGKYSGLTAARVYARPEGFHVYLLLHAEAFFTGLKSVTAVRPNSNEWALCNV